MLARTADTFDEEKEEERFVVLKREPNHYVLLKMLPPCPPENGDGDGKGKGGCGGTPAASSKKGQALFRRSELPDVIRRLWQIDPRVPIPALAEAPSGGVADASSSAGATDDAGTATS